MKAGKTMKKCYPIILTPMDNGGFLVYSPDFDINTSGENIADAMNMARDAISVTAIADEDINIPVPEPSDISEIKPEKNDTVIVVDVDFETYRKELDNRSVKKYCSIPAWLCERAEKAGINFSQTLQDALIKIVGER